jgi:CheY-like chemotaxis protein
LPQQIRTLEEEQKKRVAAIALTSPTQPLERQLDLQAKFQVCLSHPIDPAELATTIACLTGILERS